MGFVVDELYLLEHDVSLLGLSSSKYNLWRKHLLHVCLPQSFKLTIKPSDGACLFLLWVLSFTLNTVHSPASTDPCKVYQRSRTYWKTRRPSFTSVHAPRVIYSHITADSLVPATHQWRGLCLCCLTKISSNSCCLLLTSSFKKLPNNLFKCTSTHDGKETFRVNWGVFNWWKISQN